MHGNPRFGAWACPQSNVRCTHGSRAPWRVCARGCELRLQYYLLLVRGWCVLLLLLYRTHAQAEQYVGVTSGGMDQAISMMGQQVREGGGGRGKGGIWQDAGCAGDGDHDGATRLWGGQPACRLVGRAILPQRIGRRVVTVSVAHHSVACRA